MRFFSALCPPFPLIGSGIPALRPPFPYALRLPVHVNETPPPLSDSSMLATVRDSMLSPMTQTDFPRKRVVVVEASHERVAPRAEEGGVVVWGEPPPTVVARSQRDPGSRLARDRPRVRSVADDLPRSTRSRRTTRCASRRPPRPQIRSPQSSHAPTTFGRFPRSFFFGFSAAIATQSPAKERLTSVPMPPPVGGGLLCSPKRSCARGSRSTMSTCHCVRKTPAPSSIHSTPRMPRQVRRCT